MVDFQFLLKLIEYFGKIVVVHFKYCLKHIAQLIFMWNFSF